MLFLRFFGMRREKPVSRCVGGLKRGYEAGFTLIEILVVIVILVIVSMTAIPMMSSASGNQLRAAANIVAADMEYAKSMAIKSGQTYSVKFDEGTASYEIPDPNGQGVGFGTSQKRITHPVTRKEYVMNFGSDSRLSTVRIDSVNFDSTSEIRFDYLGSPNLVSGGYVRLISGGKTLSVNVEAVTGFITITE